MKKNNLLLCVLLVFTYGCNQKRPTTLLSKWDLEQNTTSGDRFLASDPGGQCLKDNFTVETLKREVNELEKKFAKSVRVKGKWKHLDLSTLPVPQANLLLTYGDGIGDLADKNAIDYSACQDVPCIFNRIYGKENYVGGYVHYLWYLKLGYILSADNHVPLQVTPTAGFYLNKNYRLEDYLYSKNELYGLWRLTFMLEAPYLNLHTVGQIQRIPRGSKFDDPQFQANECGLATHGSIRLADGCLKVRDDLDSGYIYEAMSHELAHHIDFVQGMAARRAYRSELPDYKAISGWDLGEYVDTRGVTRRKAKLVSEYAGTDLAENFAESLSIFRVDGEKAKRKMEEKHYKFVSDDYYRGRSFDRSNLLKNWLEDANLEIEQKVLKGTLDCSDKLEKDSSHYFSLSDFSSPVMPEMMMCLGLKAREISDALKNRFMSTKPEGCLVFNDVSFQSKVNDQIKSSLAKAFSKSYEGVQEDKSYLARVSKYYKLLTDKTLARDAYIACYGEKDEKDCYREKLEESTYTRSPGSSEDEKEMVEMYLSYYPYSVTKELVQKGYQEIIFANSAEIAEESKKIWRGCFNGFVNDEDPPTGSFFTINKGYMMSSIYNCLNLQIPEGIKRAARSIVVNSTSVADAKEELILFNHIQPLLVKNVHTIYEAEREDEFRNAKLLMQDSGRFKRQLFQGFDWIKNASDDLSIVSDCREKMMTLLSFKKYYFHLSKDLFRDFVENEICSGINKDPSFTQWMKETEQTFNTKVLDTLESSVLSKANEQAALCAKRFPQLRFRNEREQCLLTEWTKIEEAVISKALSDPSAARLKVTKESLMKRLDSNRIRFQIKVMRAHFE